jgi:hypothetical protein
METGYGSLELMRITHHMNTRRSVVITVRLLHLLLRTVESTVSNVQ